MATISSFPINIAMFMIIFIVSAKVYPSFPSPLCEPMYPKNVIPVNKNDIDPLQFTENLEFLEAEWFLWGALGHGLDVVEPKLSHGGPLPSGVQKANLDFLTEKIIEEFANQEVGHLRVLKATVGLMKKPQLDLSSKNWAKLFDEAFGYKLTPPFDPYRNGLSYMVASYAIPYVGLVGYTGTNPFLYGYWSKRVLAGLLAVESGQDAVIRMYLYERANEVVHPYNQTVSDFTTRLSELRDRLAKCGLKDEGLFVPPELGAENGTSSNILSANYYSISYKRTPAEILRIVYGTGNEHVPGGFYPKGGNGRIGRELLKQP